MHTVCGIQYSLGYNIHTDTHARRCTSQELALWQPSNAVDFSTGSMDNVPQLAVRSSSLQHPKCDVTGMESKIPLLIIGKG